MIRITALMDNKPSAHRALTARHGLSYHIACRGRQLLFDCGSGPEFLDNARRLDIDLGDLDGVILSHSHYDHAGGYRFLLEAGLGCGALYTGPGFFLPKYAQAEGKYTYLGCGFSPVFLQQRNICHQTVTGLQSIGPGIWLLSGFPRLHPLETVPRRFVRLEQQGMEPDDFADEVCLILQVDGGLVLLVGCSHPGILNMADQVRRLLGQPIRAIYGGTHLSEAGPERIEATVDGLHQMGVAVLGLSHCSGDAAEAALQARRDTTACHLGVGDVVFYE